ncbi:MAG: polysaccharide biosynthesis/export family protein [Armatimonadota bacterium]
MKRYRPALIVCMLLVLCICASVISASDGVKTSLVGEPFGSTAAALDQPPAGVASVDASYRIAEEDVLRMDVWGEQQLTNMQMQVTPGGKINVPYIGEMQAAGLTQSELTQSIADALVDKEILLNPSVQITLMIIHKPTVRVWGAVNRPGEVYFKEGDKVMDAIAGAGSYVTEVAWLEKATLTRKDATESITIDVKKMVEGDLSQNFELKKGDTIYIPTEDYQNKFYVLGQVHRPGIYDLKDNTSVLSAVGLAGGPTDRGVLRSTVVVRGNPDSPERVQCDLTRLFDKADLTQDITLQPGDVVIVPESKKPDWSKISQVISSLVNVTYLRRYGLF